MKRNRNRLLKRWPGRLCVMALVIAMSLCMMPGGGLLTGAAPAYADEITLYTSDMTLGSDITLEGNTTIIVDSSIIISSISMGNYDLTVQGDGEEILSVYGSGIKSGSGSLTLKEGGKLDLDLETDTGTWPAAVKLTNGKFIIQGGELFMIYRSKSTSAYNSYGIEAQAFEMSSGTATITCTAENSGAATGISADGFTMTGGSLGVDAETKVSDKSASGISTRGATSDADFLMEGGALRAEGIASAESYGIYWTADRTRNRMVIDGGEIAAKGRNSGINSWVPIEISNGADVTATSNGGVAIYINEGALGISGLRTRVLADSGTGSAIDIYKGNINLASGICIVYPEGGTVGTYGTEGSQEILDSGGDTAPKAEIVAGDPIPTNIAVTYDASKAFPTTCLTGYDVSLHFRASITSHPGIENAAEGWYVYGASQNKADLNTNSWTCLVRKLGSEYQPLNNSHDLLNTTDEYYFCFNIEKDGTRPFDPGATYTATVNGQPAEYVVQPMNEYDQLFVYKRVYLDESSDTIWSLDVHPEDSKIVPDGFRQFSVTTVAATTDEVDWSVSGGSYSGTYITNTGNLHAGAGETAGTVLKVRATSKVDPTVYDEVSVDVVDEVPVIESVTLSCERTTVCRGTTELITAEVVGTDIHDLNWELIGSDGSSYFTAGSDSYRYLQIDSGETADQLTVRATSVADPTKYGELTLTLKDKDAVTGPINITFDESAVTLSDGKTGKQVTQELRDAITSPSGNGLDAGQAPGGWYVYKSSGDSKYTSLVSRISEDSFTDDVLYKSDEPLSRDAEYYLWFNLEACSLTHTFDNSMDLADLDVTVNGHRVNGETVIAKWGGALEVYYRVYFDDEEVPSPIERIYGSNRYKTAFDAADHLKEALGVEKFPNIVIASGMDFPDALAGAYLAEVKDAPVLLTNAAMAPTVAAYVNNNMKDGGTVYILGGEGAVPAVMVEQLEAQGIANVTRLAGSNRYKTNIEILKEAGVSGQDILVCAGSGYADSLSASAVGKPVLLVSGSLTPEQKEYLESVKSSISGNFYAIGGTGVVSDTVFAEVCSYGSGTSKRVAGSNRYLTSVEVARTFFTSDIDSAVLAYAMDFPDGLAGGPVAYAAGTPLLLVTNTNYSSAKDYISHTNAIKVTVMGGETLISDATAINALNL